MWPSPSQTYHPHFSEQLIPMLGLVPLEKVLHPKTTLDKLFFLIKQAPNFHGPTAAVAFGAFAALVVLRFIKGSFKSSWIRGVPEVLIVVIASTRESGNFLSFFLLTSWLELQSYVRSSTGLKTGSIFSDLYPSIPGGLSSLFHSVQRIGSTSRKPHLPRCQFHPLDVVVCY